MAFLHVFRRTFPTPEPSPSRPRPSFQSWPALTALALLLGAFACETSDPPANGEVQVVVPSGASFAEVADSLASEGLVGSPLAFRAMARVRGDDRAIRAGTYQFSPNASYGDLLDDLREGRVEHVAMTVPEGFTLPRIATRLAQTLDLDPDSVRSYLEDPAREEEFEVPGPGLEGYLFPDTYFFAPGIALERGVEAMVNRYRGIWTEKRLEAAEGKGLSRRDVTTLASIVEAEAVLAEEKPRIAGVFLNRLDIGYPLQADPTVLYAIGEHRDRLLYAAIDSVAGHPYNTYTEPGLPPGPIGAPGIAAVDAVLEPEEHDYLYFVARPDGTHVFNRTLEEHNRTRAQLRPEWEEVRESRSQGPGEESP